MRDLEKPFGKFSCLVLHVLTYAILALGLSGVARAGDEPGPFARESRRLDHKHVGRVAFCPDGAESSRAPGPTTLLSGRARNSDCSVRIWELSTGKQISDVVVPKAGLVVDFSPDGLQVLTANSPGRTDEKNVVFKVWEISTGKQLREFDLPKNTESFAVSPGWRSYLSVNQNSGVLQLRDFESNKELRRFEGHEGRVEAFSFSGDGQRLLSGGRDHSVRLWDTSTGKELRRFEGHNDRVNAVAFSANGRRGVSGGGNYNSPKGAVDSSVHVWDLESGNELRRFYEKESAAVMHVAISPDGRRAISIGSFSLDSPGDPSIRVWDVESGKQVRRFQTDSPNGLALLFVDLKISPDGRHAMTATVDGMVRLWELPR